MTVIGAGFRTGSYTCNRCRFLLGFKIDTFEMYTSQNKKARHRAHPPRITELPNQSQTMNINHNPQSNNINHRNHRTTNIEEHSSIHLSLKFFAAAHHRRGRKECRRQLEDPPPDHLSSRCQATTSSRRWATTACPPSRSDRGRALPPEDPPPGRHHLSSRRRANTSTRRLPSLQIWRRGELTRNPR